MPPLPSIALLPLLVLPAAAQQLSDAHLLVEAQLQAAATAVAVLEKMELPPAERAARLLPLAHELARLHASRSRVDASQLEEAEARAAADAEVQRLALRLLRAMELCAAADYAGSHELRSAVHRLALAIEGELAPEGELALDARPPEPPAGQGAPAVTGQSGAESAH